MMEDDIVLRRICTDFAVTIRESQSFNEPMLVQDVLDDADILFNYIKTGNMPEPMRITLGDQPQSDTEDHAETPS